MSRPAESYARTLGLLYAAIVELAGGDESVVVATSTVGLSAPCVHLKSEAFERVRPMLSGLEMREGTLHAYGWYGGVSVVTIYRARPVWAAVPDTSLADELAASLLDTSPAALGFGGAR